jgi:hypothetical protein
MGAITPVPQPAAVQESIVLTATGERIGWATQEGYIQAFHPQEWISPHPGIIGYVAGEKLTIWGERRGLPPAVDPTAGRTTKQSPAWASATKEPRH